SLQEFRDFYVLKSPGRRKGVMADVFDEPLYVLDEDKVKAAGYPHKLPKSITAPEVLIPHDVPIEQVQVVEYNAKMREVFKEAAGLNVGVKKVGEEKKIGIIPDVVPSVGCALSGFGCVKVVDETPSEIERVARVPEITEVGKEVKVISEIAEETVEKPSTFAKLWPFKLNKHRNVEVPGVKFSTVDITIPGIPNRYVTITEGDVSIKLYKKNVWRPSNFDDQLEFGDEFLQLHVDVTPSKIGSISAGKDAIKAFDKLKKLDLGIPIVGDTTNPALLKQAEKMGGKRVKAPNRFRLLIEENSGPLKEGDKIVERVIILPEKVGVGKAEAKAAEDVVGVGKERVVVQEIEEISEVNQKDEIMGLLKDFPLYQRNPQEL
ncbi:hypothetical protein HYX13_05660, partial [Candidatus Woesearchaeota archaeon]|nr:hypothetical protein [Candidatus Woesearchaeota archaeon]